MEKNYKKVLWTGLAVVLFFGVVLATSYQYEKSTPLTGIQNVPQIQNEPMPPMPVPEVPTNNSNLIGVTEPVEEWKLCRNKSAGYEVRYPASWNAYTKKGQSNIETKAACNEWLLIFSPHTIPTESYRNDITITYTDINEKTSNNYARGSKSLDEYLAKIGHSPILKEDTVAGEKAVWLQDIDRHIVLIYKNEKIFNLTGYGVTKEAYDSFLSTFKFIE